MNVIAILNHMGVYFKEEPIRELHRALERLNFQIVYPNDRDDLLKLIENNGKRKANAVCNTCSLQTKLELLLN
ncbi:lysine decarboxylase CadA [Shigella sonnei]|nr:lysine decarboxylase CadA [Shigella sonnei]